MNITEAEINGLFIIEPRVFEDQRGHFFESFRQNVFEEAGLDITFIQDNQSKSQYGVIRGLHYQRDPYAQSKLIRVVEGEIYDVALDMRKGSPHFGKWFGIHLSADNKKQLFIPAGFAHGFSVLSETAIVIYKCDEYYMKDYEGGISLADPDLQIDWKIEKGKEIVSEKDRNQPRLKDSEYVFGG